MSKIEIANPTRGGASFTSFARAKNYILEGRAVSTENGKLLFLNDEEQKKRLLDARHTVKLYKEHPEKIPHYPVVDDLPHRGRLQDVLYEDCRKLKVIW